MPRRRAISRFATGSVISGQVMPASSPGIVRPQVEQRCFARGFMPANTTDTSSLSQGEVLDGMVLHARAGARARTTCALVVRERAVLAPSFF